MEIVQFEKVLKIVVYILNMFFLWDDVVIMVLEYVEIFYDKIYDLVIVMGVLLKYDWLYLYYEDFIGQYGKFYVIYCNYFWYCEQVVVVECDVVVLGYNKVL